MCGSWVAVVCVGSVELVAAVVVEVEVEVMRRRDGSRQEVGKKGQTAECLPGSFCLCAASIQRPVMTWLGERQRE